jgi:hypothetical protein
MPFSVLTVGAVSGVGANLIAGSDLTASALAAAVTASSEFVRSLVSDYFNKDSRSTRRRRDLVIRINSRIQ